MMKLVFLKDHSGLKIKDELAKTRLETERVVRLLH